MQSGDYVAFKTLFHRYYQELSFFTEYYVQSKECAEELVADLFIKLWEKRETLQVNNLKSYLYQSAKNSALNHLRKIKLETESLEIHTEISHDETDDPYNKLLLKESHREMNRLIDDLPERRKVIFVMSRIDGLSYKEIAGLLNISIRTVEDQMLKAVKTLRMAFSKKNL